MKNLKKTIILNFVWAVILTIFLPSGILCVIFGAIKHLIPLIIVGILAIILGFYVMPILWIKFAENKQLNMILSAIEDDNIYQVTMLSEQFNRNKTEIIKAINTLIQKRYLTGYLFIEKDHLELNNNKKQIISSKCPNCGSTFSSKNDICEYCGYKINKNK